MQSNILTPSCRLPSSETVHGAVDPLPAMVQHVGVDHRRLYIPMPEEFLNGADVISTLQELSSEGMTEGMGRDRFVYFGEKGG